MEKYKISCKKILIMLFIAILFIIVIHILLHVSLKLLITNVLIGLFFSSYNFFLYCKKNRN